MAWTSSTTVYMDGHERDDVKEYRKVFLHDMAKFEKRMV